ncbi:hypothetical protein GCM10009085_33950 [Pseudomonas avellanae]|nr:hypothetical protein GCM10009085_33950 [Pseudomonas avellanae]
MRGVRVLMIGVSAGWGGADVTGICLQGWAYIRKGCVARHIAFANKFAPTKAHCS